MLEELCHIPVVGVVPYMDIDLEDEDSLSPRLEPGEGSGTAGIDLAVIRFPRISNFTDFNVFSSFPGVRVRYVSRLPQLGNPDMVFLPGTKSTIEDLMWFRQSGLESAVLKLADRQVPLWGICGGYQMMGEKLSDGEGVEACSSREEEGMGLLPLRTEFHREKTRTQVEGSFGELDGCLEPCRDAGSQAMKSTWARVKSTVRTALLTQRACVRGGPNRRSAGLRPTLWRYRIRRSPRRNPGGCGQTDGTGEISTALMYTAYSTVRGSPRRLSKHWRIKRGDPGGDGAPGL